MRSIIVILSVFSFSLVCGQKKYAPLTRDNIIIATNHIQFTTASKPVKEKGWLCYRFDFKETVSKMKVPVNDKQPNYYPFLLEKLTDSKHKLTINKIDFTGFLKIVNGLNTSSEITVLQYKNGSLEQVDNVKNPYYKAMQEGDVQHLPNGEHIMVKKPVLYLYPTKEEKIHVEVELKKQQMISPYPAYNGGWEVVASPSGKLKDSKTNREHYCLFWEAKGEAFTTTIHEGFVVEGNHTIDFLEKQLRVLGLTEKEANEFIIFWAPQLEQHPYNAIYFATNMYEETSTLKITPQPDQVIRIMMLWEPLQSPIKLAKQELKQASARNGFTAVEWGGAEVNLFNTTAF